MVDHKPRLMPHNQKGGHRYCIELSTHNYRTTDLAPMKTSQAAKDVLGSGDFTEEMDELFSGKPTGTLQIANLQSVVERLERLEAKLDRLSEALNKT